MKDFRLSELKAHCDKMFEEYGEQACERCGESEIGKICLGHFKNGVSGLPKFERRDMLDLPFKECCEHEERGGGFYKTWRVYYRGYPRGPRSLSASNVIRISGKVTQI